MKKILLLLILTLFILTGCDSIFPTVYSDSKVKSMVKEVFPNAKFISKSKRNYNDSHYSQANYEYEYKYSQNGVEFSVFSYSAKTFCIDGTCGNFFYDREIYTNYFDIIEDKNENEINMILNNSSIETDNVLSPNFTITSLNQLDEVSKLISDIDNVLSFNYNKDVNNALARSLNPTKIYVYIEYMVCGNNEINTLSADVNLSHNSNKKNILNFKKEIIEKFKENLNRKYIKCTNINDLNSIIE